MSEAFFSCIPFTITSLRVSELAPFLFFAINLSSFFFNLQN
jgi:hypothetical protein